MVYPKSEKHMKIEKDVILAVFVGVLIGGLSAFLILFLPNFLPKTFPKTEKEEAIRKEELTPAPPVFLTLENPQDEAIFSENEISVSGKTRPGALVTVISPTDEEVIEADREGGFETKILLEEGVNELSVTSYGEKGEEDTKSATVYYTKEEI